MNSLTREQIEVVKAGLNLIIAKCEALNHLIEEAQPEIVDRLMRDVAAEAHYIGSKCYQSPPRRLIGANMVEISHE